MRRIWVLAALVAATTALAAAPALGDDHRGDPVIDNTGFGEWWYNDDADELVLLSGEIDPVTGAVDWAQWCFGPPTLENVMRSWQQDDGLWRSKIAHDGFPIHLYEGTVGSVIAAACTAVLEGGEFPQPVAVGTGASTATFSDQPEPWLGNGPPFLGMQVENSVRGFVTYADGAAAKVQGSVAYTVIAEGGGPGALDIELLDVTVVPLG